MPCNYPMIRLLVFIYPEQYSVSSSEILRDLISLGDLSSESLSFEDCLSLIHFSVCSFFFLNSTLTYVRSYHSIVCIFCLLPNGSISRVSVFLSYIPCSFFPIPAPKLFPSSLSYFLVFSLQFNMSSEVLISMALNIIF